MYIWYILVYYIIIILLLYYTYSRALKCTINRLSIQGPVKALSNCMMYLHKCVSRGTFNQWIVFLTISLSLSNSIFLLSTENNTVMWGRNNAGEGEGHTIVMQRQALVQWGLWKLRLHCWFVFVIIAILYFILFTKPYNYFRRRLAS